MSHTRGLVEVTEVGSSQLALRSDIWHDALYSLPVREPVFGAWPEASFHPPPSFPPPSGSLLYPDLNQQALLDNSKGICYLPGFYAAVSCDLAIDTPVPSEDHVDKDASRQTPSQLSFSVCSCRIKSVFGCGIVELFNKGALERKNSPLCFLWFASSFPSQPALCRYRIFFLFVLFCP